MPSNHGHNGSRRSPYPSLLGSYDWGQAGMRPATRTDSVEFWACLGSLILIAVAVVASAVV
jgi:hypothetical protein